MSADRTTSDHDGSRGSRTTTRMTAGTAHAHGLMRPARRRPAQAGPLAGPDRHRHGGRGGGRLALRLAGPASPTPATCSPTPGRSAWRWWRPGSPPAAPTTGAPTAGAAPRCWGPSSTSRRCSALTAWIAWEAVARLRAPERPIDVGLMAVVAAIGLAANLAILVVLRHDHGLNARSAFLHVVADTVSSVAILAGAAVLWLQPGAGPVIDPLLSLLISALILWGALRLIREITDILMESVPEHLDRDEVAAAMAGAAAGVLAVHDLHIWTISSGPLRPLGPPHGGRRGAGALRRDPDGGEGGAARALADRPQHPPDRVGRLRPRPRPRPRIAAPSDGVAPPWYGRACLPRPRLPPGAGGGAAGAAQRGLPALVQGPAPGRRRRCA